MKLETVMSEMQWKDPRLSTPEGRAVAGRAFRLLREMGYSYEQIPDHLEDRDGNRPEPWEVYALPNPGKTAAQVKAWRARHCRGADA
jgi:hypothetical protein